MTTPQFCLWLSIAFACGWFLARWLTFAAATAEAGRLHRAACAMKATAKLMRDSAARDRHVAEAAEHRAGLAEARAERSRIEAGEMHAAAQIQARRLIIAGLWAPGVMNEGRPMPGTIVYHN